MSVRASLASSSGQRDEQPNIELARKIALKEDRKAVEELIALLNDPKKAIQSDTIKTLYEIGKARPDLIEGYVTVFIDLVDHPFNRLQWGAMFALAAIADKKPQEIYEALGKLSLRADSGTVVTRDQYMQVLLKLYRQKEYAEDVFELYKEQISGSPVNQLCMYAENIEPLLEPRHRMALQPVLLQRLAELEQEPKRKRISKVIKKLRT